MLNNDTGMHQLSVCSEILGVGIISGLRDFSFTTVIQSISISLCIVFINPQAEEPLQVAIDNHQGWAGHRASQSIADVTVAGSCLSDVTRWPVNLAVWCPTVLSGVQPLQWHLGRK